MPEGSFNPESLTKAISDFLEGLQPLLRFLVLGALPGSHKGFKQAFEDWKLYFQQQDKVLLAFTINHGLIGVERHFTDEQLWLLIRWNMEHGDEVVNRRLPEFVTLKAIQEMVRGWESIPYLMCRKKISADVLDAYELGLHTLVTPALLPLAEGLASEIAPCDPRCTNAVKLVSKAQMSHPTTNADFGSATVEILERFYYGWQDFSQPATPGQFNRHRILHGRVPDYGTAANSIRAFLLVDTVADMWHRLAAKSVAAVMWGHDHAKPLPGAHLLQLFADHHVVREFSQPLPRDSFENGDLSCNHAVTPPANYSFTRPNISTDEVLPLFEFAAVVSTTVPSVREFVTFNTEADQVPTVVRSARADRENMMAVPAFA
jgi:hypothetical protein